MDIKFVVAYPNNDAGGRQIIEEIEDLHGEANIQIWQSLGRYRFHGLLNVIGRVTRRRFCGKLIGNHQKETPAFGCPAVNIGGRTTGRLPANNVLDTAYNEEEILAAIHRSISDEGFRRQCQTCQNPYGAGNAGPKIAEVLADYPSWAAAYQKKMTYFRTAWQHGRLEQQSPCNRCRWLNWESSGRTPRTRGRQGARPEYVTTPWGDGSGWIILIMWMTWKRWPATSKKPAIAFREAVQSAGHLSPRGIDRNPLFLPGSAILFSDQRGRTLNVLQTCPARGRWCIVHTSTSEVYGTAQYCPIDERHPLKAQSPYAASKIGAGKMAEAFYLSFNLLVITMRPFNTFGPRQIHPRNHSHDHHAMPEGRYNSSRQSASYA